MQEDERRSLFIAYMDPEDLEIARIRAGVIV
jgi:hypothetical protein